MCSVLWPTETRDVDDVTDLIRSKLIQGVLLMEVRYDDERVKQLRKAGIPVGLIGRTKNESKSIMYADRDFEAAVELALTHLKELGHKKVAFLGASRELLETGHGATLRVEEAFRSAASALKLKSVLLYGESTIGAGHDAFKTMRNSHADVTGVVSMNVPSTLGFLQAARDNGVAIPADLSLVSLGDEPSGGTAAHQPDPGGAATEGFEAVRRRVGGAREHRPGPGSQLANWPVAAVTSL